MGRVRRAARVWMRGLIAALISGGANGVTTGFAAIGIDPERFNLDANIDNTLKIAAASALCSAILGCAAYLKQSPLPPDEPFPRERKPLPPAKEES